jgi:uncharacterized membrane protein
LIGFLLPSIRNPWRPATLYFFFASIMIVITVLLTPAGMVPDETTHFLRAVQVSQGSFTGIRKEKQSGGMLPDTALPALLGAEYLIGHPEQHYSTKALDQSAAIPWSHTYTFTDFHGASIYAPGAYLPEALAIRISRLAHQSVLQTFFVARLVNGFLTVMICTLAIAISRRGTAWLFALGSLPMTLHLAGSCSQDGMLIGLALLAAAILSRHTKETRWLKLSWIGISALFAVLAAAKPPLLICALFPAAFVSRRYLRPLLPFVISFVATILWYIVGIAPVKVQFQATNGVSDSGQIKWMLLNPFGTVGIVIHTLRTMGKLFWAQMIGRLGWLDTPLSGGFYALASIILVLSFLSGAVWKGAASDRQSARAVWTTLAVGSLSVVAMMLALYVIWSPVGAGLIAGIQGRYFLTLLPFLVLLLPTMPRAGFMAPDLVAHQIIVAVLAGYLVVDAGALSHALIVRYW